LIPKNWNQTFFNFQFLKKLELKIILKIKPPNIGFVFLDNISKIDFDMDFFKIGLFSFLKKFNPFSSPIHFKV